MAGIIFMVAFVGACAYGCLSLILEYYGVRLPQPHPALTAIMRFAGPPLLIFGAGFSYLRSRAWRGMRALRSAAPGGVGTRLARGDLAVSGALGGTSRLERLILMVLMFGVLSVPYWLRFPGPEWWCGGGLLLWMLRRF